MSSKKIGTPAASGSMTQQYSYSDQLDPLRSPDELISHHIIGIHDSHAPKYDVDSLFKHVSNVVKSSTHIGHSLDLKRPRTVELREDKVKEFSFMPTFSTLKEIACQMTCKPFSISTAHQTIVGILEKLRSYPWDVKAVIALSAFALDYGETWRFSFLEATKESAPELRIFKLGEEVKLSQDNEDLINTLVDRTLQLIEGIMTLERKITNKTYSSKDVPALYAAPRDFYTYWAILALLACANRMTELDWSLKSEVVTKLKLVVLTLNNDLTEIQRQEDSLKDLNWRLEVFRSPSGILQLLKALIFHKEIEQLKIFDNATKQMVGEDVLRTRYFLLFISGLDNIEDEIWLLKSIHEVFIKDKRMQQHQILWVPVVEESEITDDKRERFEHLKSLMPWYVLLNLFVIKGKKALEMEWPYMGMPIVVVTNPRGEVINKNALHMIFVWKIEAFPFRPEDEERLFHRSNWLWKDLLKLYQEIRIWESLKCFMVKLERDRKLYVDPKFVEPTYTKLGEEKYIFIYGGTDKEETQRFGTLIDKIKSDPIIQQAQVQIEQFNLSKADPNLVSNFWHNIKNSFLSLFQKENHEQDPVYKDILTLLSYRNEKVWVVVTKGPNKVVSGYYPVITGIMAKFHEWNKNVLELQGFDNAIMTECDKRKPRVPPHCLNFPLNNIRSGGVPTTIFCPDPSCDHKQMEIESVSYRCCHGIHHHQQSSENVNGKTENPDLQIDWTP